MNPSRPHFLFLIILTFISFHSYCNALDLQCTTSNTVRVNVTTGPYANSTWCCSASYPIFMGDETSYGNPPPYNYADPKGKRYSWLPTCGTCQLNPPNNQTCAYSATYGASGHYCCRPDYTCDTANMYCRKSGYSTLYGTYPSYGMALPAANLDLCRFGSSGLPGSPCAPQITCEAYSQTQYRCYTCTDPRVGPSSKCNVFTCPAGNYCSGMQNVDVTNSTATLMIVNHSCPMSAYCPQNATAPIACTYGQLCNNTGLVAPVTCLKGYYCPTPLFMNVCPAGSYCPSGSRDPIPCPVGNWCPEGVFKPIGCPAGLYCNNGVNATACQPGYVCPSVNLTDPIPCVSPNICPYSFMTSAYPCWVGMYCPDPLTALACPKGNYCSLGSIAPTPCSSGEYNSDVGRSYCSQCKYWYFTSDEGAETCKKLTPKAIGVICAGIIAIILLVVGCVFLVRWCRKLYRENAIADEARKQRQAEEVKQAAQMREAQAIEMFQMHQQHMAQVAALTQAQMEMQRMADEAAMVEFQTNRQRVRDELMERLMRDLRTDLKLHHPQPLPHAPVVERDDEVASQLQQYEQFLIRLISPQFDNELSDLFPVLNMLAANPYQYSTVDFHNSLLGIRSLVIESFPAYHSAAGRDDSLHLQSIRESLMRELSRHVQVWLIKVAAAAAAAAANGNNDRIPAYPQQMQMQQNFSPPPPQQQPAPFFPVSFAQQAQIVPVDPFANPVSASVNAFPIAPIAAADLISPPDAPLSSPSHFRPSSPGVVQFHVAEAEAPGPGAEENPDGAEVPGVVS